MESTKVYNVGDKITIKGEIISQSGQIMFSPGQEVTIRELVIKKGYWSRLSPDIYYPDELTGIKLEEESGIWRLDTFNL